MKTENKLQQLLAYLQSNLPQLPNDDIWEAVEEITIVHSREVDPAIVFPYAAPFAKQSNNLIVVENCPETSLGLVALLIFSWCQENDEICRSLYELEDPRISSVNLGQGLYNIVVNIDFVDPIIMQVDENGAFNHNGTMYSVV